MQDGRTAKYINGKNTITPDSSVLKENLKLLKRGSKKAAANNSCLLKYDFPRSVKLLCKSLAIVFIIKLLVGLLYDFK